MRTARFYAMHLAGYIVDTTYALYWASERLHRGAITAYRITGDAWWAGEMRANLGDGQPAKEGGVL